MMILLAINRHNESRYNELDSYMDTLKVFINPELYKLEHDAKVGKKDEYVRVNSEFAQQSFAGRATGKMHVSTELRKAIDGIKNMKSSGFKKAVRLQGPNAVKIKNDDDTSLG